MQSIVAFSACSTSVDALRSDIPCKKGRSPVLNSGPERACRTGSTDHIAKGLLQERARGGGRGGVFHVTRNTRLSAATQAGLAAYVRYVGVSPA